MSYAPASLKNLGSYWTAQGGVNLGIVGNAAHTKGYHLGKDRIYDGSGPGIGARDYSVQTARDKAGLTDAASAIDLGRLDGSLTKLWAFSRWFAGRCYAGDPAYRDVREVIFWSTARQRVIGWSALAPGQWINDYGDLSHKTHTHISYYRDSQSRDKRPGFAAYFESPPTETDDMELSAYLPGHEITLKPTSNVRTAPSLDGALIRTATQAETWTIIGFAEGGEDVDGSCVTTEWAARWAGERWEYTSRCNVTSGPTAPEGPADCTDEVNAAKVAGYAEGKAAGVLEGREQGADEEYARQVAGATVAVKLVPRP